MIFDNDKVVELARRWKYSHKESTFSSILRHSQPLIQSILCQYPAHYREDLFQEFVSRLPNVLDRFDPDISNNLYGYIARSVNNLAISHLRTENREVNFPEDTDDWDVCEYIQEYSDCDELLEALIVRNRHRFPSILCNIDDATEYIYYKLMDSSKSGIVYGLMKMCSMSRHMATVVYHSTVFFLRNHYYRSVTFPNTLDCEFTMLPDLQELIGATAMDDVVCLLSGMYIKVP